MTPSTINAFTLLLLALRGGALAQETTTTTAGDSEITPAPSQPGAGGATLLRPSNGEVVTASGLYTVRWSPPPQGPLAIEAYSGELYRLVPNRTSCDGWIVNTECNKWGETFESGTTSYVWNLTDDTVQYMFGYDDQTVVKMGIYVDNLEYGSLPRHDAPWYAGSEFTITTPPEEPFWTSTSSSTLTEPTDEPTTSTSTDEGSDMPTDVDTDMPTPTDRAVAGSIAGIQAWKLAASWVGAWLVVLLVN